MAWATQNGVRIGLDFPLLFDPGASWEYSIGLDWAGRIVETLSGKTLEDYFQAHIFGPLGMSDTSFMPPAPERLADMSARDAAGGLTRLPRAAPPAATTFSGGGGLFGTASDYLKFLNAIICPGAEAILKPASLDVMVRRDDGASPLRALRTTAPAISNDLDIWGDAEVGWSLAFMVNRHAGPNGRPPGSGAWAGLSNTYYWCDPTQRIAGIFLTQLAPFADKNALAVFGAFERAIYDTITA